MKPQAQGYPAQWVGKPGPGFVMFDELDEHKAPFEVKLTFMNFVLFAYPMCLLLVLDAKPTVQHMFGNWAQLTVVGLIFWTFLCHAGLTKGLIRRGMAAILTIVFPAAVVAGICQVHAWQFTEKAAALVTTDCSSFLQKAELQRAWQAASNFRAECMAEHRNITGLTGTQAQLVEELFASFNNLDFMQCPGYAEAKATWGSSWDYLADVEQHYKCGGWCVGAFPIFVDATMPTQDSCSLAVGRALANDISLLGTQVTFYMVILFMAASFLLMLSPRSLAASY